MKNEIKEILNYLKEDACYEIGNGDYEIRLYKYEVKILLDYITNLQKDYELAMEVIDKGVENTYIKTKDYKSRIEKAIEYINENKHLSMFADCRESEEDWNYDLEINPRELLNILQGVDK